MKYFTTDNKHTLQNIKNYCLLDRIDYQCIQHYEPVEYFDGKKTFKEQIVKDAIKKEYCKKIILNY
jgi:hypothetical protein